VEIKRLKHSWVNDISEFIIDLNLA